MNKNNSYILLTIASFFLTSLSLSTLASIKSLYVDVEIDSNLRLRSKDNIDKTINALKRDELVRVVDEKIKKYKGEDFILVRKILFPELVCHDVPHDDGQYLNYLEYVMNDQEFKKYKKKSKFKNCPILSYPYPPKRRREAFQRGSPETLSEITGYVPLKHLKGFNIDESFSEKHRSALAKKGYRLVAPHDFTYFLDRATKKRHGFEGWLVSSYFIDRGYYFLPVFKEKFTKKKWQRFESKGNSKAIWRYSPAIKVGDQFLLHLVKEESAKKRYSVFALLNQEQELVILKSFEKTKEIGELLHLIPNTHKLVLHKDYIKWNKPMPFFGMDRGWESDDFSEHRLVTKNKLFEDQALIKEIESSYNTSTEKLDYSFVIFSDYYEGDWEVNPSPIDGTMHAAEIFYKLNTAKDVQSTGLYKIFNVKRGF